MALASSPSVSRFGSHLHDGPVGKAGVIHREAVVVFGDGHDILCARILEELCPLGGVEVFGAKEGNQILVALG